MSTHVYIGQLLCRPALVTEFHPQLGIAFKMKFRHAKSPVCSLHKDHLHDLSLYPINIYTHRRVVSHAEDPYGPGPLSMEFRC